MIGLFPLIKEFSMDSTSFTHMSPTVNTLSNGMRVVSEHLPYVHSASIGVWVRVGSVNEDAKQAGIAHFLEHLFFKGTQTRSARELMQAIESKGGHMNAFTSRETTCLYVKTLDRHVHTGIEILADIVKHSTFCDLEKERNVILEEIASGRDVPDEHVHDLLAEQAWPDHPLGRPIAGYEKTVEQTGLEEVQAFKEKWYRPENMYLSIVGNFDEGSYLEQLEDAFGSMPAAPADARWDAPTYNGGLNFEDRDIAQNHLTCGFPSVAITDPKRYTYDMLSSTFGGGSTSRLFESIREQEGLAYAIYSFNSMYVNSGMLALYAAVAPENLQRTIDLCCVEMRKLQDELVPEDELVSNREQLKGGLVLALEGTFNRMARMVRSLMLFDRVVPVEEILASVDAVTAEQIQKEAQATFRSDQCTLGILGPKQDVSVDLPG